MKLVTIEARDLPELWFLCVKHLMDGLKYFGGSSDLGMHVFEDGTHLYTIDHGSFEGERRIEFDHVTLRVKYPESRPLVPDVPQGVPVPATQEYIDGYMSYLITSHKARNEDYTYGEDLERQIPLVIEGYKKDGHNQNQMFMAVGNAQSLALKDPQCLRMIDTRIQGGALHFIVYFRSWDLWGGLPANLGAIQILKEYMALQIGVEDGQLIASSKGLHLYEHSWKYANLVLRREG